MTSLVDAESVLAVDIGSVNTRVLLFDVVDGQYHFISSAVEGTTAGLPYQDIGEGVYRAIRHLQEITGRVLIDKDGKLIIPSQPDASGVDRLAVSFSAGEDLNIVNMGLLSDVSLESAERLAGTTYGRVVERMGLTDTRRSETQVDALVQAHPDIIIVAGGTEKGATRSVYKQIELVAMASKVIPRDSRPVVIYCGNGALSKRVKETLERDMVVGVAPNLRPGIEVEDLDPAVTMLAKAVTRIRTRQMSGFSGLASLSSIPLIPTANAFGRIVRFLSQVSDPATGVLGVDLGASATTLAIGQAGNLYLNVFRSLGIGSSLPSLLQSTKIEELVQWIPFDLPVDSVRDYLYQKSLRPSALPLTHETLAIEQAAARQILTTATQRVSERWPNLNQSFDLVIVSGSLLTHVPTPQQALLMVLDGIQPVGVGTYLADPYGLTQALGAISAGDTLLPVQIIDSGIYSNLGTVIAPLSEAKVGTVILNIRITFEDGSKAQVEVKQGALISLPIRNGQKANLTVEAQHNTVLDPCRPHLKSFKVTGGACGVVVDTRGRPLLVPAETAKRIEWLNRSAHAIEERRMV